MKEPFKPADPIARLLRELPDRQAPQNLLPDVLASIQARSRASSWESRPLWHRLGVTAGLTAVFMLACWLGGSLGSSQLMGNTATQVRETIRDGRAFMDAMSTVLAAVFSPVKAVGSDYLVAGLLLLALGYGMAIVIGSAFFRLTLARK